MNCLNPVDLDDLLQRFRRGGWSVVGFEEALTDPVYQMKYEYFGRPGGQGTSTRLHRLHSSDPLRRQVYASRGVEIVTNWDKV